MTQYQLSEMQILVVDCQTTGGNAAQSHLIEIGWMPVRARDAAVIDTAAPTTHIIRQPQSADPPKHIQRLTGLEGQHFKNATDPRIAWQALRAHAEAVATSNGLPLCPVVIHFARFEMPFLRKLHAKEKRTAPFPMDVFCSHQMAARVWPQLPRKGLRAVAGYLGHSVPPLKRCASHLHATATIWCHLVKKLNQEMAVSTLEELRSWMQRPSRTAPVTRTFPMPRQMRLSAPAGPGIYHFRRSNDDLLYIGKARSLKKRVNSYFQTHRHHSERTLEMLTQAAGLDVTPTRTALEAALLESDEIKRLGPPYNQALRKGRRELYFSSRNFKHQTRRPDDRHPLGPVPTAEIFAAVFAMGKVLRSSQSDIDSAGRSELLCLPERYGPDEYCFRQGLDLFQAKYDIPLRQADTRRALIRIGHQSWREKLALKDSPPPEADLPMEDTSKTDRPSPFEWTPEAVMNTMTSVLRRCGFLLRRSRWLVMLSESTVAWHSQKKAEDERYTLVIEGGRVVRRGGLTTAEPLEPPARSRLPTRARQANLDLEAYDRLRVLSTELRRLVTEGRLVSIRFNHRAEIAQYHLGQLFRWI